MRLSGASLLLASSAVLTLRAQAGATQDGPLQPSTDVARVHLVDNDTIVRMKQAGLGDDLLVQTIQLQPGRYDTSPEALIDLKKAGLSDRVLSAMQVHGTGLKQRAEADVRAASSSSTLSRNSSSAKGYAATETAATETAAAALAAGVDEIGVYYRDKEDIWQPLKSERVQFRSGGWVKSTLTYDIVKQDLNGRLEEERSPLVLHPGTEILLYAPAGTQAEEYDFLRLREKSHAREFRVKTGGVLHSETGSARDEIEFHPHRLGTQMYAFTLPKDLEKGEYGVLPPGSSNTPGIANAGKIFTFSIRE